MPDITQEKTHALLEKLSEYVMRELQTRREVDGKIDKLAEYVMNEVPRRDEVPTKGEVEKLVAYVMNEVPTKRDLERVERDVQETKEDVKLILDGMDTQVKEMEILRTEQVAIKSGLSRVEKRVDALEKKEG